MSDFADRLKQLRGKESREDFAKRIGISSRSLVNYEQGDREPKIDIVKLICANLGISADWLIFGDESGEKKTADMAAELQNKNSQHIENTTYQKKVTADVGGFVGLPQGQEMELLTLYRENNQLLREIADLRAENSRLQSQLAAAVGVLGKTTAGVTSPNAMDKAG